MSEVNLQEILELQKSWQADPLLFCSDVLGSTLWKAQQEIWQSVWTHKYTAVKSGHATGKSYVISNIVLGFLNSFYPSKVITTAPTFTQVEKITWSEIRTLYNKSKIRLGGDIHKTDLFLADDWFAAGVSTDEADRFQGFHSPHLLLILDEASGVNHKIWEAATGLMTGANCHMLVIGNPLSPTGDFFECFQPESKWHKMTISCLDTPNYLENREVVPGLVSRDWVEEKRKEWGEDSALWSSKVIGEFPVEGDDTLIPLTWVEQARKRIITEQECPGLGFFFGTDVARYGSNKTVLTCFDGYRTLAKESHSKKSNTEVAGLQIGFVRTYGNSYDPIGIDDTGLGGGVVDILDEQGYHVIPLIMRARADQEDKFYDLRSEMYWMLRERFKHGTITIPDEDRLASQLTGIRYEMDHRGRIKIFPKERLRKEGLESPDEADSLAMAVYVSKEHVGRRRGKKIRNTDNMISCQGAGGY